MTLDNEITFWTFGADAIDAFAYLVAALGDISPDGDPAHDPDSP